MMGAQSNQRQAIDFHRWKYRVGWAGESALLVVGRYVAHVQDCDGDYSVWSIGYDGDVIDRGEVRHEDVLHREDRNDFDEAVTRAATSLAALLGGAT